MTTRASLANLLEGSSPLSGAAAATGYSTADLTYNLVARAVRTSSAATSHQWVFGPFDGATCAAVFDAKSAAGVLPTSVVVAWSNSALGPWTTIATITPNTRGDGIGYFSSPGNQYWRYTVALASSDELDVGLLWLGSYTTLTKTWTVRNEDPAYQAVVQDTDGGGTFAVELSDYRRMVGLDFSPLTVSQRSEVVALHKAVRGAGRPFVLHPDTSDAEAVMHGRVENSQGAAFRRYWDGTSLPFRESGRALP